MPEVECFTDTAQLGHLVSQSVRIHIMNCI
jgi:hypothetical protein